MVIPVVWVSRRSGNDAREAMSLDPYLLALADSTRLKLRGSAVLAEGGADAGYNAAVLFHEAARAEARALAAVVAPTAETRLRSAIERAGCLMDGRDPSALTERAWPQVLEISDEVAPSVARALRARIDARMAEFLREYSAAANAAPDFWERIRSPGKFSGKATRQLEQLLRKFPGDPRLWTMKAFCAIGEGSSLRALEYARRAQKLFWEDGNPEGPEGMAPGIEVVVSAKALSLSEAQAAFDASYARVRFGAADVDLCFATVAAGLLLAERLAEGERHLWERIASAASKGGSLQDARTRPYEPFFLAARMIAAEKLADREPGLDILYRAGLGAAASRSASKNPVAILRREMTGRLMPSAA
jgi:hypothetical protein